MSSLRCTRPSSMPWMAEAHFPLTAPIPPARVLHARPRLLFSISTDAAVPPIIDIWQRRDPTECATTAADTAPRAARALVSGSGGAAPRPVAVDVDMGAHSPRARSSCSPPCARRSSASAFLTQSSRSVRVKVLLLPRTRYISGTCHLQKTSASAPRSSHATKH